MESAAGPLPNPSSSVSEEQAGPEFPRAPELLSPAERALVNSVPSPHPPHLLPGRTPKLRRPRPSKDTEKNRVVVVVAGANGAGGGATSTGTSTGTGQVCTVHTCPVPVEVLEEGSADLPGELVVVAQIARDRPAQKPAAPGATSAHRQECPDSSGVPAVRPVPFLHPGRTPKLFHPFVEGELGDGAAWVEELRGSALGGPTNTRSAPASAREPNVLEGGSSSSSSALPAPMLARFPPPAGGATGRKTNRPRGDVPFEDLPLRRNYPYSPGSGYSPQTPPGRSPQTPPGSPQTAPLPPGSHFYPQTPPLPGGDPPAHQHYTPTTLLAHREPVDPYVREHLPFLAPHRYVFPGRSGGRED